MFKNLLRDRKLLFLFLVAIAIKLFSLNPLWVELYYTYGIYPLISGLLRTILGWIPFSIGDLAYTAAGIWLVGKVWKLLRLFKRRQVKEHLSWIVFRKYLKLVLLIYIIFNVFWGLNYYRQGITRQLGLTIEAYTSEDLFILTNILQQRLNASAERIDSVQRLNYNQNSTLFNSGIAAYKNSVNRYSFLSYNSPSIKPSLFTSVGHWFGFTGYYNPISAEAQLKTTVPVFLKPFIVTHEIAHQLGYAKENEASFVAYLTCKEAHDANFVYSAYFEMFRDAILECRLTFGKEKMDSLTKGLHPRVKWDSYDLHQYLMRERNFIEPFMSGAYDKYLKLNNQPKGKATYDEVIAYLIAYMKKFGSEAI